MNHAANISSIETYFDKILKGKVSDNVFAGTLPSTLAESLTDCVVIQCGSAIRNRNAYNKGIVNIYLYTQPSANGRKNVALLSKMEKALAEVLETEVSEVYSLWPAYSDSGYDSTYNMHFVIQAVNLIIK